jgi:NTE family protein
VRTFIRSSLWATNRCTILKGVLMPESINADPTPVVFPEADLEAGPAGPEEGMALCLSGGGYRAMLFHVGAVLRLNEVGMLGQLKRISSVSGGSITAAVLGMNWNALDFRHGVARRLDECLVQPIQRMARQSIDTSSVVRGISWFGTIGERIVKAYNEHLFRGATLQSLPNDDSGPRFVINATNVQSGALWRFSRPYMADYKVGRVENPDIPLALAVAASSAFPPFLSPVDLDVEHEDFVPDPECPLQRPPYTEQVVLTDGGVYDNLGLETVWKRYRTVLVSDGGGQMQPEEEPARDWAQHSYRINSIIDNQVRSLRKRHLIGAYQNPADPHNGAFWGIRTNIADYGLLDAMDCPHPQTLRLAETSTRLRRLDRRLQNRLMNWGYAVCDAALRRHVDNSLAARTQFPFADGVG